MIGDTVVEVTLSHWPSSGWRASHLTHITLTDILLCGEFDYICVPRGISLTDWNFPSRFTFAAHPLFCRGLGITNLVDTAVHPLLHRGCRFKMRCDFTANSSSSLRIWHPLFCRGYGNSTTINAALTPMIICGAKMTVWILAANLLQRQCVTLCVLKNVPLLCSVLYSVRVLLRWQTWRAPCVHVSASDLAPPKLTSRARPHSGRTLNIVRCQWSCLVKSTTVCSAFLVAMALTCVCQSNFLMAVRWPSF